MPAKKYLKNNGGVPQEQAATQVSTGATNAGDVVALDDAGLLDLSLFPPSIGPETVVVPASENLSAGNLVNLYNASGTTKARKADASTTKPAHGFVLAAVTSGNNATVILIPAVNSALSALTAGSEYYLSDSTPGGVTNTEPSGAGKISQKLGIAKSTTELVATGSGYIVLAA